MTQVAQIENIPTTRRIMFSVSDVRKMTELGILHEESGWELIDGNINEKIMGIGAKHASVVRRLGKLLERKIGNKVMVSGQNPIHLDDYNEPEPDITLLKPHEDFYAENHPTPEDVFLVIEVSETTVKYDREVKKILYAEAGITEFWLVNLNENTIETYSQPKNGNYRLARIMEAGETVKSTAIENLEISVEEILGL
jgi:Uma2 family endonuclease